MATPDNVIQANIYAKRSKLTNDLVFDTSTQNGFFVTFKGKNVLEFDSNINSKAFKDDLNSALVSVKSDLTAYYQSKIDAIV